MPNTPLFPQHHLTLYGQFHLTYHFFTNEFLLPFSTLHRKFKSSGGSTSSIIERICEWIKFGIHKFYLNFYSTIVYLLKAERIMALADHKVINSH